MSQSRENTYVKVITVDTGSNTSSVLLLWLFTVISTKTLSLGSMTRSSIFNTLSLRAPFPVLAPNVLESGIERNEERDHEKHI